jgi:hypothetical protein
MEPRILFTSSNIRVETTLTDREAYEICRRITNNTFVSSLVRQFNSRGLTNRQIPYLHLEALRQLEREREAAASRGGPNVPHDVPAPVETPAPVEVQTRNGFAVNRPETVPTTRQRRRRRTQSTNDAPRIVIPSEGNLGRLFKLEYDIPLGEDRTPVFPNPSGLLQRFAIRTSGSMWMVQENRIPYTLIQEMREAGCIVWDIPVDMSAVEKIREYLIYNLKREIQKREESYAESCGKAGEQSTEKKMDSQIDTSTKRFQNFLRDVAEAASLYGLDVNDLIQTTYGKIATLQTESYRRARVYAAAVKTARESGTTDGVAVANRAEALEEVPAGILADVIEDSGDDVGADTLRREFGQGVYSQTGQIPDEPF